MRLVVDTNVLVSGLLAPFGAPGVIVSLIAAGRLVICYDARILAEYRDVLRRPAFPSEEEAIAPFLAQIQAQGEMVVPVPLSIGLRDADDETFLEVAAAARVESWSPAISGTSPKAVGMALVSCRPASSWISSMMCCSRGSGASRTSTVTWVLP